jgi:CheY-like chemotaxis protein
MDKTKVLLIDDDDGARETLAESLELAGLVVVDYADGQAALADLQRKWGGVYSRSPRLRP